MADENARRSRNWTFLVYPDSAPDNWREILDDMHLEWVESPLHEFDSNPTGELKKAHTHVLVLFNGSTTFSIVKEITDALNAPIPVPCHNAKSMVRYMAHLDNPEKFQYSLSDIKAHGGVDVSDLLRPSSAERYTYISEMRSWVKDNGIIEYQDLMDYADAYHHDDWWPLLCDNSSAVMQYYIKSQRHRSSLVNTV